MRPEAKTFETSNDVELTFLFDFPGMVAAENAADTGFAEVVKGALSGRIGHLAALILGGLKKHHPRVTIEQAFDLIESEGEALGKALWGALESAMPQEKAGAPNPRPSPNPGTGSGSSPRGSRKGSTKPASGGRRPAATA